MDATAKFRALEEEMQRVDDSLLALWATMTEAERNEIDPGCYHWVRVNYERQQVAK